MPVTTECITSQYEIGYMYITKPNYYEKNSDVAAKLTLQLSHMHSFS